MSYQKKKDTVGGHLPNERDDIDRRHQTDLHSDNSARHPMNGDGPYNQPVAQKETNWPVLIRQNLSF